jgi:NTP pyrophosphatase (non-canonical NTP hydrolase)
MMETQETICAFADETFGPATSNMRIAARANEEMAELLRALSSDDNHPKAAEEIADVVIILHRLARNLGADLRTEIDRKMKINRLRTWRRDDTGHGYHVRDRAVTP